jgi:NAD(P)-dependent dehydrogenase (short-subunit alcohol dehydrogenase family)
MLDRLSEEEMNLLRESIPLCEIGTADDVANLVIFLISPAARHVTGVTISLSGGLVMN